MALGFGVGACSIYDSSLLDPGPAGGSGGSSSSGNGGGAGDAPDASVGGSGTGGSGGGSGDGSGGSAGSAGSAGSSAGSAGTSGLETEILDDMEDGNGFLFNFGGRNGDWFAGTHVCGGRDITCRRNPEQHHGCARRYSSARDGR